MKIAIHNRPGSFSDHWIDYCKRNNIEYKIVNAYNNDIIKQVADCDIFMWHHHQNEHKDTLVANSILFSIQGTGKSIYPNFNTTWHFDNKIGQRYLFDSLKIPHIPTYIFFHKNEAQQWISQTSFPKVFKLKIGSSSSNVMLVKTRNQANKLVAKAFGKGISTYRYKDQIKERYRKYKLGLVSLRNLLGLIRRCIFQVSPSDFFRFRNRECGYVYFQDYMSAQNFDIRVFVVGDKAIAVKRMNRPNDFRASGGGYLIFDKLQIDERCIKSAFEANKKLKMQSVAFDFIFDDNGNPLVSEVCYCSSLIIYKHVYGYWTSDMQWHECENINICDWIIEKVINDYTNDNNPK